jgi:hypothetical protein
MESVLRTAVADALREHRVAVQGDTDSVVSDSQASSGSSGSSRSSGSVSLGPREEWSPECKCGLQQTSLTGCPVSCPDSDAFVDEHTLDEHFALCLHPGGLTIVPARDVSSVCDQSEVSDVAYFHRKHTELASMCKAHGCETGLDALRAQLGRRDAGVIRKLLRPADDSVALSDVHDFLCRLPGDQSTALFEAEVAPPVPSCWGVGTLAPSTASKMCVDLRKPPGTPCGGGNGLADVLARNCVPVVEGRILGYQLRHVLGNADTNLLDPHATPDAAATLLTAQESSAQSRRTVDQDCAQARGTFEATQTELNVIAEEEASQHREVHAAASDDELPPFVAQDAQGRP